MDNNKKEIPPSFSSKGTILIYQKLGLQMQKRGYSNNTDMKISAFQIIHFTGYSRVQNSRDLGATEVWQLVLLNKAGTDFPCLLEGLRCAGYRAGRRFAVGAGRQHPGLLGCHGVQGDGLPPQTFCSGQRREKMSGVTPLSGSRGGGGGPGELGRDPDDNLGSVGGCIMLQRWPADCTRITRKLKEDLMLWNTFLEEYNRVSFWRQLMLLPAEWQVHSNAAGGTSLGVSWNVKWCAAK